MLQHSSAELSAHQAITAEQECWTSIAQLAAEYDSIAAAPNAHAGKPSCDPPGSMRPKRNQSSPVIPSTLWPQPYGEPKPAAATSIAYFRAWWRVGL